MNASEVAARRLVALRQAVADYMESEGCSCCRDHEAHPLHRKRLAELLSVPPHKDDPDYYDFSPYRTEGK